MAAEPPTSVQLTLPPSQQFRQQPAVGYSLGAGYPTGNALSSVWSFTQNTQNKSKSLMPSFLPFLVHLALAYHGGDGSHHVTLICGCGSGSSLVHTCMSRASSSTGCYAVTFTSSVTWSKRIEVTRSQWRSPAQSDGKDG